MRSKGGRLSAPRGFGDSDPWSFNRLPPSRRMRPARGGETIWLTDLRLLQPTCSQTADLSMGHERPDREVWAVVERPWSRCPSGQRRRRSRRLARPRREASDPVSLAEAISRDGSDQRLAAAATRPAAGRARRRSTHTVALAGGDEEGRERLARRLTLGRRGLRRRITAGCASLWRRGRAPAREGWGRRPSRAGREVWAAAERRAAVLAKLPEQPMEAEVRAVCATLGVSRVTLFRWLKRYRKTGRTSALLPRRRGPSQGMDPLPPEVLAVVERAIFRISTRRGGVRRGRAYGARSRPIVAERG